MTIPRLSAAVVACDEEDKIGDCIDSLFFVDEIIMVDSGSTDRTVEIAREKGAKVLHHKWYGYIEQKTYAFEQTTGEWVLNLDADERISAELRKEIEELLKNPTADGYAVPRLVYYINRWIWHSGWYPARKVRLFRREKGKWGGENPHDKILIDGKCKNLKGDIYHLSFDNISDHVATLQNFTNIASDEGVAKGRRSGWFSIFFRPLGAFLKMYFLKRGFLDGVPGFIVSSLSAYHVFSKHVKIWEKNGN